MVLKIKEEDRGIYVYEARKAYRKCRNKKAKRDFLNHFVEESGYNRKQAIRLLQKQRKKEELRKGAPRKLSDDDIRIIRNIWKYTNYVNAEYLHANRRRWLTDYSSRQETPLSRTQIERICSVSYKYKLFNLYDDVTVEAIEQFLHLLLYIACIRKHLFVEFL